MNTQSPLVPQGSFLEQKNKGRARVKIAVFVVLAIHGIGLLALLMQGCKKEPEAPPVAAEDTNATTSATSALAAETNTPPPFTNPSTTGTGSALTTNVEPPPVTSTTAPTALAAPTEYKVVKGDTYTTIARKFHVSTRALQDANPGVDPNKLQIGQTLHIPPAPVAATTGATNGSDLTAAGEQIYSVQSGDTLSKIADKFKVSVKAIQSANNLTTTRIRVGQKLKIPVKSTTAPAPATTPSGTSTTQ